MDTLLAIPIDAASSGKSVGEIHYMKKSWDSITSIQIGNPYCAWIQLVYTESDPAPVVCGFPNSGKCQLNCRGGTQYVIFNDNTIDIDHRGYTLGSQALIIAIWIDINGN